MVKQPNVWTPDKIAELKQLILEGKSVQECADILGRTYHSIRGARVNHDLPHFKKPKARRWKGQNLRTLALLRQQGKSRKEIGEYFGIGVEAVNIVLDRYGFPRRQYREPLSAKESAAVAELYSQGKSYAFIAYKLELGDKERVRNHVNHLIKMGRLQR